MTTGLLPQGSAHRVGAAAVGGCAAGGAKHRSVRADVFDFSERTRASRSSASDVSSIGQSAGKASSGPPQANQERTEANDRSTGNSRAAGGRPRQGRGTGRVLAGGPRARGGGAG